MIIQCEQCRTKFRLDDSKVTEKGVKVRCAKCRHVFSVEKERPEAEPQADFGAMLDQSSASAHEETFDPFASRHETPAADVAPVPEADQSGHSDLLDETFSNTSPSDTVTFDMPEDEFFSFNKEETEKPLFEANAMSDSGQASLQPVATVESEATTDNFSDFDFDFEDDTTFADTFAAPVAQTAQQETVPEPVLPTDDFPGFNFDNDNPFSDTLNASTADTAPSATTTSETMTGAAAAADDFPGFDFKGDDPFGDATSTKQPDEYESPFGWPAAAGTDEKIISAQEESGSAAFDFTNIKPAAAPVSAEIQPAAAAGPRPDPVIPFTPLAMMPETSATTTGEVLEKKKPIAEPAPSHEELPPLSISSRRKQSPLVTGAIAVAGVLIASALAFLGYSMFLDSKGKIAQETGKITIRSLDASFVKNPTAGELLVITGEALNNFKKPRAAIQIKGIVYGANSQILSSKDVYAGNTLTKEQLANMPLDKIEAAMANQFGDSLANLEVAPGKAIPFVIVIAQLPADAKDYGVESLGSTVATGKQ